MMLLFQRTFVVDKTNAQNMAEIFKTELKLFLKPK